MFSKKSIFYTAKKEELQKYEKKKRINYDKYLLQYYEQVGDYDSIKRIIDSKKEKKDENCDLYNYYACRYFYNKGNKFMYDKIYYKLSDYNKLQLKIKEEYLITNLSEIYENELNQREYRKIKKDKNIKFKLYFCNIIIKRIFDYKIEKEMSKYTNKILIKKRTDINELFYLLNIVELYIQLYYTSNLDDDMYTRIRKKVDIINVVCRKIEKNLEIYQEMLKEKYNIYRELVCKALSLLIRLDSRIQNQKDYVERIEKYADSNHYTCFINSINKAQGVNNISDEKFIAEAELIVEDKTDGNLLSLIGLYNLKSCSIKKKEDFIKELLRINQLSQNQKKEIEIGEEFIRFWEGDKFDLKKLDGNFRLEPLINNILEFDGGKISYLTFLENINKLSIIDTYSISNWNRIRKIFERENFDWLITIITKLSDVCTNDYNFLVMLKELLIDIYERKVNMFLSEFSRIEMSISAIDKEKKFYHICTTIYIIIYDLWDENVKQMTKYVFENLKKYITKYESRKSYVFMVFQNMIIHNDYNILGELLKYSQKNLKKNDYLFLRAVTMHLNNANDKEEYINIIKYMNNLFSGVADIQENEYKLIGLIAGEILQKNINYTINYGRVAYVNKKNLVFKDDFIDKLKEVYDYNQITKIDVCNEHATYSNLLAIIIQKIFFKYIQKFKAGIVFVGDEKASPKDIITELRKVTGQDRIEEQIKRIENGIYVNTFWFNIIGIHEYFKMLTLETTKIFNCTSNKLLLKNNIVLHPTSLILLAKLDLLDIVKKDKETTVINSNIKKIKKLKDDGYIDYSDVINDTQVCYDELLNKCCEFIDNIELERKIEVISANVLGLENMNYLNKIDMDIIKFIAINEGNVAVIVDDPYYLNNSLFNKIAYSTLSYLVYLYMNKLIDSSKLYECVSKLKKMNYNMYSNFELYDYLLKESNDIHISEVIDIIGNYQ